MAHRCIGVVDELSDVAGVGGENERAVSLGDANEVSVDDVRRVRTGEQRRDRSHIIGIESDDPAGTEQAMQHDLAWVAAGLGDHRRSCDRSSALFEEAAVVRPHLSVISISSDER